MSGLFPTDFYNGTLTSKNSSKSTTNNPPLLKDYLIDLDTGFPIVSNSGQFTIVTGLEAVIMQTWRKLHTPQGVYEIFSSKYGNTFDELIGKGKSYADAFASQKLQSALVDKVYIKSVNDIKTILAKDKYIITFTINSIYGDTKDKVNINLED